MVDTIINKVISVIVTPLLTLLFACAFIVFIWGVFDYLIKDADPTARETGRDHIIWGVVGMFIMVSAYGIINFVISTLHSV